MLQVPLICLDMASDPIVTCCGHLFWWPCFSRVKRVQNGVVRECPVCKGEAKDSAIIPIYINNLESASRSSTEPPRPKAKRVKRRARAQQLFLATSAAHHATSGPHQQDRVTAAFYADL